MAIEPPKKGFFPALNHYNLTVEILRYLKHTKLMRVVSKLSKGARFTVHSSLVWQKLIICRENSTILPNTSMLN